MGDRDIMTEDQPTDVPPGEPVVILETELEASRRAGVAGVELLQRIPGLSFDSGPCLRFPRRVHLLESRPTTTIR